MTCWTGSSVSSLWETMKEAFFSSSLMVGSLLTSSSNCSSGTSGRILLPFSSTRIAFAGMAEASAALTASAFGEVLAAVFFAGAAFAGAFLAVVFLAAVLAVAAVFAGAFLAGA